MNQKETATIRQALRLIATGETLDARRMLAQLTIATTSQRSPILRAKPEKPVKPCYLCKLAINANVKRDYWILPAGRKYVAMLAHPGCVKRAEIERDRIWAENDAKRAAATLTMIELDTCACEHSSQHHAKDSLENLLACDMPKCACDHFHYQTESEPISAAAGA